MLSETQRAAKGIHMSNWFSVDHTYADLLPKLRPLALSSYQDEARKDRTLVYAAENVEPLHGLTVKGLPLAVGFNAFLCSSVTAHTDEIPPCNYLLYLGTVEGESAVHTMYTLGEPRQDLDFDNGDMTEQDLFALGIPVAEQVLKPGDLVSFDARHPHWLTVSHGGRTLGRVVGEPPGPKLDPMFKGVPLTEIAGMFVALASHDPMPLPQVRAILETMSYQPGQVQMLAERYDSRDAPEEQETPPAGAGPLHARFRPPQPAWRLLGPARLLRDR